MDDLRRYTLQQLFRNYKESHMFTGLDMPVLSECCSELSRQEKRLIAEVAEQYEITQIEFSDQQLPVAELS
jgi:hypothetical protein